MTQVKWWSFDKEQTEWSKTALDALAKANCLTVAWQTTAWKIGVHTRDATAALRTWVGGDVTDAVAYDARKILEISRYTARRVLDDGTRYAVVRTGHEDRIAKDWLEGCNTDLERLLLADHPGLASLAPAAPSSSITKWTGAGPVQVNNGAVLVSDARMEENRASIVGETRKTIAAPIPRPHKWDRYCAYPQPGGLRCTECGCSEIEASVQRKCIPKPGWREQWERDISAISAIPDEDTKRSSGRVEVLPYRMPGGHLDCVGPVLSRGHWYRRWTP